MKTATIPPLLTIAPAASDSVPQQDANSGQSSAAGIVWNLLDLYAGPTDPAIAADQEASRQRAEVFAGEYRGKIGKEGGPDPDILAKALAELEQVLETAYKPMIYAGLLHAADSENPEHGRLVAAAQQQLTHVKTELMFFDLEWIGLSDQDAAACIRHPACKRWTHYLASIRRYKPHTLSEAEEIILARKHPTGASAFARLFDEILSKATYTIQLGNDQRVCTQSEALALLFSADRPTRIAAHTGFTDGLRQSTHLTSFIYNNLLEDHATDNDLRAYQAPISSRHLSNEIDAGSVEAMLAAVARRSDIVRGYYQLKARLLGLETLYDYDRYAPVELAGVQLPRAGWEQARQIVQQAYTRFSPVLGDIVSDFFDKRWIDAAPRPGKRGGAFSSSTVPSLHPYILMNFTDRLRDVMTLAHELGHGVHQYLSREQGLLQADTPLTLAETASVFGEMLTFHQLLGDVSPAVRLSLLCSKLEDSFSTVFRQATLTRFELQVHAARADGELTPEQFDAFWLDANREMFGSALQLTEPYGRWWSYIPHFIHSPFYCYAYSFGELLVLSLWRQYQQEKTAFVPRYLDLLRAGGSATPTTLLARLGHDITKPDFWDGGLDVLAAMTADAAKLADEVLATL